MDLSGFMVEWKTLSLSLVGILWFILSPILSLLVWLSFKYLVFFS